VLVLTTYDLDSYVYRALAAGAAGFLLKATPPDRLVAGIETVAAGESLLAPSLTRRLIEEHVRGPEPRDGVPRELESLTEREREVFTLVAQGLSNDDIARALVVSEATVKTHLNRLIAKLGNRNRVQLVVLAYETGLVRPGAQSTGSNVLANAPNNASSPGRSASRPATDISSVASDAPGAANHWK
jgi:DNA-binding NarL/FixJ family response regulator